MLSIVIPVYNRLENVKRMLFSFQLQKLAPEYFEVIIVDDGSTDNLKEWLRTNYGNSPVDLATRPFPVLYYSGGPNKGFRGGRARNIGSFNSNGDWLLFVDSDVVLNDHALHHYDIASKQFPNNDTIIVGPYHWLEPLVIGDAEIEKIMTYGFDHVERLADDLGIQVDKTKMIGGGVLGMDPRSKDFREDFSVTMKGGGLGAFSGNICYPKKLFYELGGFDEVIVGHGGEDADLGLTADSKGANWLFYKPVHGWHMWHPRDQERNEREVKANILYIDSKHMVGAYANAKKWIDARDYSDPAAYMKNLGAIVVKRDADPTAYAIRIDLKTRIGISSVHWLNKLGFMLEDIKVVPDSELDKYELKGATRE